MNAVTAILLFFILFLGLIFVYDGFVKDMDLSPKGMEQEHVITVLEEPDYEPRGDGYLIVVRTEENTTETYQASSSVVKGIWKPEDRKEQLQVNHTYYVKTYGVRNSVLGTYKNIIEPRELSDTAEIASETARIRNINAENQKQLEAIINNTSRQTA